MLAKVMKFVLKDIGLRFGLLVLEYSTGNLLLVRPLALAFWANNMHTGNRVQNRLAVVDFLSVACIFSWLSRSSAAETVSARQATRQGKHENRAR